MTKHFSRYYLQIALPLAGVAVLLFLAFAAGKALANEAEAETISEPPQVLGNSTLLRWAPPTLTNPITINLGTGATSTTMDTTKDYIIKLPATKKTGYTWLMGGRNVVIIGGYVTTPTGYTNTSERRTIYIKDNVGTVHIEGVLIDSSGGGEHDAFAISSVNSIVQLQNIRVEGLIGSFNTEHSDIVQPWGGVKELRIDRMTGSTNYQGFYFVQTQPYGVMGKIITQNVNFIHQNNPVQNVARMMYMTYDTCEDHPGSVSFSNVYFKPSPQRSFDQETFPSTTIPPACRATMSNEIPHTLTWPGQEWVTGAIIEGDPPTGDFVPQGIAGTSYVSPGYESDTPQPTQTPIPQSTRLDLNLLLQAIGNGGDNQTPGAPGNFTPVNPTRTVTVSAHGANDVNIAETTGTVTFNNATGNFLGAVSFPQKLPIGAYNIKVTSPRYLRSQAPGFIQVTSQNQSGTIPVNSTTLIVGDSNGDNILDILDYNIILDCYSDALPARSCEGQSKKISADLNDDGAVNGFDFNTYIRNLTTKTGN